MTPRVSVVIPLYNKEAYVRRALDSVAAQTFTDFEALIVDDGSTDGGTVIVEAFGDRRFRLIRQTNAGPGAARNRGVAEAKGELTAFVDADDEWLPGYLERVVGQLDDVGPDVATCSCAYFDYHGPGVTRRSTEPMWRERRIREGVVRATPAMSPVDFAQSLAYMHPCTTLVRTEVFRRRGGFYENRSRFGEDSFLWLQVLLNERVAFELTPLVVIHTEAGQLSKNMQKARPVEPFLEHPELIEQTCPAELRPLLARFFSFRAFKTACMLGYWGDWQRARELRERFRSPEDSQIPLYWASRVCATPLGAVLGAALRRVRPLHS